MKRVNVYLGALLLALAWSGEAMAVTCTSLSAGNWNTAARWSCGHVPVAADTVVVAHNITLDANPTVAGLTINAGQTLNDNGNGFDITVTGNVVNNGTYGVVGGGDLFMTGAGTTISGSGSFIDTKLIIDANNITLPAGSTMNFASGAKIEVGKNVSSFTIAGTITDVGQTAGKTILKVKKGSTATISGTVSAPSSVIDLDKNTTLTNNGTVNVQSLKGKDATSVWTQGANSNLTVTQTPAGKWLGTLNASATGNTVTYGGTANPLTPSGNAYYHLTLSGSGAQTLPTGLTVAGNFTMSGTATTAAPAALTVGGNFIIGAGNTFTPGTGTVMLNGASIQTIGGGTADLFLFNLTVNNPAGITLARNVIVTGTLTGPVTLTSTCPNDYILTSNGGATVQHSCAGPTVNSINTASPNPTTSGAAVSWTVSFGTSVTGVTASNFALVPGGGVTGATITSVTGAGATWTVNADAGTGSGTLGLNMVNVTGINPALTTAMPFVGQVYTVSALPPGTQPFDAVEVGGAIGSPIRTKIAGLAFNLDVLAVKNGAIDTGYKKTVTVDLIAGAALCDPATPALAGVTVTPVPYTYDKAIDQGRHTFSFTSSDAYPNVRVRVQDDKGKIGCSYDNFAIRPASFTGVSVTDSDWQTAGTTRALTNTGASGGNVHKAGQPFTVRATAVNAAAATTTNYVGTPTAILTACAGTACTATFGTFSIGTGTAVAGVINSTTATYSEAGSFALQLQDQTFANVDALDSTTTERYFSSAVINVGRFVPDHFALSAGSIVNRADVCPAGANCPAAFTYMGEQMNAVFTLTAQAAGGSTTQNYAGVLAKLAPTAAGNPLVFGAVDSTATPTYLTARLDTGVQASGNFAAGAANVVAPLAITHPTTGCPNAPNCPDGPYALLDIGIAPRDIDGVIMAAYDLDTDATAGNDHTKVGRTEARYGRMKLSNAHGSELLKLPIGVLAQYWNGTTYVTNALDNNSTFAPTDVIFSNYQKNLNSGETSVVTPPASVVFTGGAAGYRLSAPGAGNNGSVDMTVNALSAYLPSGNAARATFGVYKGSNSFIYLRENY